MKNHLVELKV